MFDGLLTIEKSALERLTNERRVSGSVPQELNDTLSSIGVYWDEVDNEYFSIDAFQKETLKRLTQEYVNEEYAC